MPRATCPSSKWHSTKNRPAKRIQTAPTNQWGQVGQSVKSCNSAGQRALAMIGAGGWEYLLSCHNGGPCALAATQPPTIGQQVRPRDYSRLHLGSAKQPLVAAPFAQELAVPVPTHVGCSCDARGQRPPTRPCWCQCTWPRVQHARLVSPTHPPCGLAILSWGRVGGNTS
jgi:hypothetical protein